jgi:hypothetical protein
VPPLVGLKQGYMDIIRSILYMKVAEQKVIAVQLLFQTKMSHIRTWSNAGDT